MAGCLGYFSKEIEVQLNNGLIVGHAYSVTGLSDVIYKGDKVHLVRVRNPWGNKYEWKGDWSDNSPHWRSLSEEDRKRLKIEFGADGEFWMSIEDFMSCFTKLEVCFLGRESLEDNMKVRGRRRYEETFFSGDWIRNISAGGCPNYRDTYWTNPQYKIKVIDPDLTDSDDKCTVFIGLMQKNMRKLDGAKFLTIGFCVYQLPSDAEGTLKHDFFITNRPINVSEFTNTREVILKLRISAGSYLIVPSTYQPNEEAQFIIRVFTETIVKESVCDDKNAFKELSESLIRGIKKAQEAHSEDGNVDKLFNSEMDTVTKSINAEQLQSILNKCSLRQLCTDPNGFQLEAARSMLACMDDNLTGKMEYNEFKQLWENCKYYVDVFKQRDNEKRTTLKVNELREAFTSAGFSLSSAVFLVVVQRFATQRLNGVSFEDWILCCVRLKNAFENMKAQFRDNDGIILFTETDYLRLTLNQ